MQAAAIPFRADRRGGIQILLVTSRTQGRWILPKGNVPPGLAPHEAAAKEAFEEAGVAGRVTSKSVGSYHQFKSRQDGSTFRIEVSAFALAVAREVTVWPEMELRQRGWWPICDAMNLVDDELRQLLARFHGMANAILARDQAGRKT